MEYLDLRDHLRLLSLPYEIYSIEALEGLKSRYTAIILKEELMSDINVTRSVVAAANSIVLICQGSATPQELSEQRPFSPRLGVRLWN